MATQVEICNYALRLLGQQPILTIEDDLPQAISISGVYEIVRKGTLREHVWNFAMKRQALPALVPAPAWGYNFQYQLPTDLLRLVEVQCGLDYRVEGLTIVTDAGAPLNIRYVKDATDPAEYDALFVRAFAAELASAICEDVTGSNQKKQTAEMELRKALSEARRTNAVENPPQRIPDRNFSWLTTRNVDGYIGWWGS